MRTRQYRLLMGCAVTTWGLLTGCDKEQPNSPPVPPTASTETRTDAQPRTKDLAALRSFVVDDKQNSQILPEGHPPISQSAVPREPRRPVQTDAVSNLKFDAPGDWKPQTPRSTMRKAQYVLPRTEGDAEDGELVVYYFGPGEGGNVVDNLERWRGQFTQADGSPLPDDAVREERFETSGLKVALLDVSGRYAPGAMPGMPETGPRDGFRMYAAVIETSGGPWFVKATGPARTMDQQREAVRTFLSSAKP
jgi:hypothetical protein